MTTKGEEDKKIIKTADGEDQEQMMKTSRLVRFPFKLHEMLKEAEKNGNEGIVAWLPHGRAFRVTKKEEFVKEILPKYFRQTKFKSFQRQLNLWGFETIRGGEEKNSIFHRFFVRDRPELCHNMTRVKIKGESLDAAIRRTAAQQQQHQQRGLHTPSTVPSDISIGSSQSNDLALELLLQRQQQQAGSIFTGGLPTAISTTSSARPAGESVAAALALLSGGIAPSAASNLLNIPAPAPNSIDLLASILQLNQQQQQQQQQQQLPTAAGGGGVADILGTAMLLQEQQQKLKIEMEIQRLRLQAQLARQSQL